MVVSGGLIAIGGAIVGGLFGLLQARKQIQADNERRREAFYLEQKVNSLMELYAAIQQCHSMTDDLIGKYWKGNISKYELDEFEAAIERLNDALNLCSIFLEKDQTTDVSLLYIHYEELHTEMSTSDDSSRPTRLVRTIRNRANDVRPTLRAELEELLPEEEREDTSSSLKRLKKRLTTF